MSAGAATLLNVQRGELTYAGWSQVHTYQVFTTDGTDGPDVVLGASGLPSFGAGLTYDPLSRVSRITPIKQEDATTHWHVDVEYSRETGNQQDTQAPPTLRPVKRTASVRWVEKALMQHTVPAQTVGSTSVPASTEAILTLAKTPFNPPITVSVPHPVVRFQRWENEFSTQAMLNYVGHVNSTTFGVYEPGWVLCTNIEASEEWEQDQQGEFRRYWLVTYEFEACQNESDTWRPFKVLNADFWFIDPADGKRKPIYVDKDGTYHGDPTDPNGATPVPSPIPLDGPAGDEGDVLQVNEIPGDVNFINLYIYDEADFNDLGLPVD